MKILKFITFAVFFLLSIAGIASETVVWQGSKQFTNWSDLLNIDGSKLSSAKADDVLCLSITASQGAQLQMAGGNNWTNFEGLEHLDISGNYEMQLTSQDLARIKQGIHIKGVNFTLTAVSLKSNDGAYATQSADLFDWQAMKLSGATQGQTCTVGLKAYAGAGWYWPETVDLSSYGSIVVTLLQPAAETMTVQLLYGENSVKSQTITKGTTKCKVTLSSAHKQAYSLNVISEKAQTIVLGSVDLTDKQGNIISTSVVNPRTDNLRIHSVEYYDTQGIRLSKPRRGVNIIKTNYEGGVSKVEKLYIIN